MSKVKWKMYMWQWHKTSAILSSTYQKLLKLMEIWRSSEANRSAAGGAAADHIPYWCHGLESCSGLPPRSLPSHPGHQMLQFTPIIGTGVTLRSFCSYIHNPGPCILGGWPLCVAWASVVAKIAPQDSF